MAQMIEKKTDRDQDLIKDYKNRMSIPDMVAKYNVTSTRIYFILDREGVPRNRKITSKKTTKKGRK